MKAENKGKRWTKKDDATIVYRWGFMHPSRIAKMLGRTEAACKGRVYLLLGTKRMNRGGYSVRSLSEETGYHYTQIRKAIKALNMEHRVRQQGQPSESGQTSKRRWGKAWDNRTWLITYDQAERITNWLRDEKTPWSHKHECCIKCGTTKRKHYSKGLCYKCRSEPHLAILREETAARKRERAQWWDNTRKLTRCLECDDNRRPHHAKGLCDNCYQKSCSAKTQAAA
jgi:hypothetical protein